jgi:hypothetical protein
MRTNNEVINLIKKGESINKIRKITGLAKSTIYHHYKKIKGRKIKRIKFNFINHNELGEFLGIFSGDGGFYKSKKYHYSIRIHTGYYEEGYKRYLSKKLPLWFNKKPHFYYLKYKNKNSTIIFHYDSKKIYSLLREYLDWKGKKTYTVKLKNLDLNNKKFNLGFLRGLIDTDGNYYEPKRRLSFSTVSRKLAYQVYKIIKYNLKITPNIASYKKTNRARLYTISIHGLNAKKIIDIIKPNNPNKTYAIVV